MSLWWLYRPWWRHQLETFSALLALCEENPSVTGGFPSQRPVTRSFDVFFDLRLNKRLSKRSRCWSFETPSRSLWLCRLGDITSPYPNQWWFSLQTHTDGWAEKYQIYIEAQNGFRRGRGTADSAFILSNIIDDFLAQGKKLYAYFVDYSKAFDYVVHENLWYKLFKLGLGGKIINILRSMYQCIRSKVLLNHEMSESFPCRLGVRQGECLSPFLFAMYVNDLESHLHSADGGVTISDFKLMLLLYADDLVIFAETPEALQLQIDKLYNYCQKWKLLINTEKSKIVVFRKGTRIPQERWFYGETVIPVCSRIPYLGLVFSSNGSYSRTQSTLADQANKAIFQLHKILLRFKGITLSAALDLFDKLITPILCYGCEVWGFHSAPDIERVHLSFCKRIMCVKKSSQNAFVYGLLGRFPLELNRQCRIMSYWLKIVTGCKSLYVSQLYQASLSRLDNIASQNWAREIKQLLCSVGFGDVWYSQGVANPVGFINAFRVRIRDIYKQNWNASLQNSPRARFFRSVVNEHQFYNQLDMLDKKSHRIALARFMASSHRLGVETGRWARPIIPFEQRLCENCQKLDDEYHFLLECTKLSELRKKCIPRYFYLRPSMFKCVQLLNSNDTKTIRMLGRYVYQAFSQIV